MKKIGIGIVVIVVVLMIGYYFWGVKTHEASTVRNYPSAGKTVIAFGDSLVYGTGSEDGGFVSKLSDSSGIPISNEGVPGNTTAQALKRIDNVLEQDPKLVIVLLGGNDALQKVPVEQTFKNLDEIVTKIEERGSMVMILGVQGGILSDPYKEYFENLAKRHQSAFIPHVMAGVFGHKEYMYDAVHPNDAGYALMAQKIEPLLKKLVKI